MFLKSIHRQRIPLFLLSFFPPLIIDQLAKVYALTRLQGEAPVDLCDGVLRLSFIFNPNGFIGILTHSSDTTKILFLYGLVSILLLFGIIFLLTSEKFTTPQQFFLAITLSGGFSNLVDRIIHDEGVVDFLQFTVGPLQSGICNPADLFVFVGGGALGYLAFHKI